MENKEKNFVSAVVYIHNAEEQIRSFLEMVLRVLEKNFEHSEIICVNDHSDDSSAEIVREVSKKAATSSVTILNMSSFHGLEMAMDAGVDLSIGDFVFEFDSTLQDFSEDEIMRIYRRSLEGFDIVNALPDKKVRFSSKVFYSVFNRFARGTYKLTTERFRVMSRRVINRINSMSRTVPYRKVAYANSGLKSDSIVYQVCGGVSAEKTNKKERAYRKGLAADSLILFTNLGYRISLGMTFFMMFIAAFIIAYAVIIYLTAHPVPGWTTIMLFLSVSFLGIFAVATVIIKYLQLLVDLVFKRKFYSFESIEKLTK
ncbi:MAG: glycosyltransferase [Pyramidobacter sp.]